MAEKREIQFAVIGGREVPARLLICPTCKEMDLDSSFDTSDPVEWTAHCSRKHTWKVPVIDCPVAEE